MEVSNWHSLRDAGGHWARVSREVVVIVDALVGVVVVEARLRLRVRVRQGGFWAVAGSSDQVSSTQDNGLRASIGECRGDRVFCG